MKYCLAFIFAFIAFVLTAQKVTISGKVIDKETNEPLPYASVGLAGKSLATITNLQGEFDFHLSNEPTSSILVVSMLGYKTYEATLGSLLLESLVIKMEKTNFLLQPIVVSDSLTGGDILSIAISRIDNNYPNEPFMMEGFYRDLKKVANTYVSLLEAAVKIYDEDYKEPRNKVKLRERVALKEVRRSLGYSSKFTSFFDQDNLLEDLLLNNNIRYRQFPEEDVFYNSLKREKESEYDGHEVFVISHTHDYLLRIYIDKKTYGIIHLDYENNTVQDLDKKRDLISKFVKLRRTIDFKYFEGKLYLNYLTIDSQINWYDKKTNELKFETELHRILLINQVKPKTKEKISFREKMRNYGLQYQDQSYNKEFWDNYNVIKSSQLDQKIVQDLEKEESLESQFKDNND
jgi:CarboxypepD_reg-like domain